MGEESLRAAIAILKGREDRIRKARQELEAQLSIIFSKRQLEEYKRSAHDRRRRIEDVDEVPIA